MKLLRFTLLRFMLLLALLWTLSGCGVIGSDSYPTPIPPEFLPTAVAQTAAAADATKFALTPSATLPPTGRPSLTPTLTLILTSTPTDTPTPIPPAPKALIQIEAPGPMSLLVSPLQLRMYVVAGETGIVQIALYGEDGRRLDRVLERVFSAPPTAGYLTLKVPFEVRTAELARLEVSTKDRAGRLESLTSIHLTLMTVGLSQINPPSPPFERAAIYSPEPKAAVSGGILYVEGAFWPFNDNPVILELRDEQGKILVERQLSLTGDTYVPFNTTLPYTVFEPTRVRLSIRQADERFDALAYLFSLLVTLNP
jgi:predicted small lipoprotein YifL